MKIENDRDEKGKNLVMLIFDFAGHQCLASRSIDLWMEIALQSQVDLHIQID